MIVGFLGVPISIAFGVLKYRLYDIDVVIKKAVVYGGARGVHHARLRRDRGGDRRGRSARAGARSCPPSRPPWSRSRSSPFARGRSAWRTASCTASEPRRTRCSPSSGSASPASTPRTTSCNGWPPRSRAGSAPSASWCGCGGQRAAAGRRLARRRRARPVAPPRGSTSPTLDGMRAVRRSATRARSSVRSACASPRPSRSPRPTRSSSPTSPARPGSCSATSG